MYVVNIYCDHCSLLQRCSDAKARGHIAHVWDLWCGYRLEEGRVGKEGRGRGTL